MKISELLSDIKHHDLVLPEFQREYVWTRDQAKQLMVSLRKGYPVGSLLFWKTDRPPELKNLPELPDRLGTIQVMLDGQQRLTTLYSLIEGSIPPYYTEADIETDITDLYYNLEDSDFQYYQPLRMRDNPLWIRVVDCFGNPDINVIEIAQSRAEDSTTALRLAQLYNENLTRLKEIRNIDIPEQVVPPRASLDEAIDIFDKVNSQGTKLTDAELALTHVTGRWPTARRVIKSKMDDLARSGFTFDLTFMTRALTCVTTRHALFQFIHPCSRAEVETSWQRLSRILDYLANILPAQAFINSTEDLNSPNTLIPLVMYLSENEGRFPNERALRHAVRWLYAAHIWARYTAQTDQRLEHDVTTVVREEHPWEALLAQIVDQRGRIEVKPSDYEGRVAQHPLYRMTHILAKAHGAVDWFNGLPLGTRAGGVYRLHSHHIFPQGLLYRNGFDPDNHVQRQVVNEVANRAFLTAETNQSLSDRPPEQYFPEVEQRYPGALTKQFIPMDPVLWKVEYYTDFLEARRSNMARKLNEFMDGLVSEPEPTKERSVAELVSLGEGPNLEFKSTLQWDVVQNTRNQGLRDSSLKTVAAFLNSDGGTLVIGVEDSGEVFGLDRDLSLVGGSMDRFLQLMSSLVADRIGPEFSRLVKTHIEELDGQQVCVVDVDKSAEPAFMSGSKGKEFYVRIGNTTRALDPEQTLGYIEFSTV
jgi:hypothetical protein